MTPVYVKTEKCTLCGHELAPTPEWAFVESGKYYCKPTCFMHRNDKKKVKEGAWQSLKKPVLHYNAKGEVINEYPSVAEAAEACGFERKTVTKYLRLNKRTGNGEYFRYKEINNA